MKIEIKIKNRLTQIKTYPSTGSKNVCILNPEEVEYTAVKLYQGWYYLKELYGWVDSKDVTVTKIIEPYDPLEDNASIDVEDTTGKIDTISLTPEQVVNLINKSTIKINSQQVIYSEDNTDYPLYGFIKNLKQSLDNMNDVIEKVSKMPNIPNINENTDPHSVLRVITESSDEAKKVLVWSLMNYNEISGIPELDTRYTNEF